ncbi:DUF2155 domain-containing protein [Candidatus Rhodobacter oscarellae]|nr:DUF2155 domain-containing protein [Candidatus Rhodobacter lobularis]
MAQQLDPNNSDGDNGGFTLEPELDVDGAGEDGSFGFVIEEEQEKVVTASGAVVRALDRVSGALSDIEMMSGQTIGYGRLFVTLGECRYPESNPASNAFGYLAIRNKSDGDTLFQGWMVASSPALNAMDHPRYDLWLLRCITS